MHIIDPTEPTIRKNAPPQSSIQAIQHQMYNKLGIVMGSIDIVRITETLSSDGIEDLARMKRACKEILNLIEKLSELEPVVPGAPQL